MADFLPAFSRLWPKALERAGLEVVELKAAEPKADGKAVVADAPICRTRRCGGCCPWWPTRASGRGGGVDGRIRTPKEAAGLSASVRVLPGGERGPGRLRAQGGAKGKDYVRSATFFDTYAARIEKLPLTDVDPVLVQYGASVAAKLRAMAGSLRGVKAQLEMYDRLQVHDLGAAGSVGSGHRGGGGVSP